MSKQVKNKDGKTLHCACCGDTILVGRGLEIAARELDREKHEWNPTYDVYVCIKADCIEKVVSDIKDSAFMMRDA